MRHDTDDGTEDEIVQNDVLSFLLDQPVLISIDELHREMAEGTYGPYSVDDVERATRDLVHAGLLHRLDRFVFATRAAIRYSGLPR